VDKYTAMLILISDAEHAIPVLVNRNGIRTIAVGAGDLSKLSLPYLTVESDVKSGDLLVSSGLDGIFPAGYPVASITKVERNTADTFALVEAKPLAQLDRDREVLLLWADAPPEPPAAAKEPTPTKPAAATPAPVQAPTQAPTTQTAPSGPATQPAQAPTATPPSQ
jgi:rod shape-determining protein MreC